MNRTDMFYTGVRGDVYRLMNTDQLRPGNVVAARYRVSQKKCDTYFTLYPRPY